MKFAQLNSLFDYAEGIEEKRIIGDLVELPR
jgi:hypothetical protein